MEMLSDAVEDDIDVDLDLDLEDEMDDLLPPPIPLGAGGGNLRRQEAAIFLSMRSPCLYA